MKTCRECKHQMSEQALAYSCIAQIGLYVDQGYGQVVRQISEVLARF